MVLDELYTLKNSIAFVISHHQQMSTEQGDYSNPKEGRGSFRGAKPLLHTNSPSPLKERGIQGVRMIHGYV